MSSRPVTKRSKYLQLKQKTNKQATLRGDDVRKLLWHNHDRDRIFFFDNFSLPVELIFWKKVFLRNIHLRHQCIVFPHSFVAFSFFVDLLDELTQPHARYIAHHLLHLRDDIGCDGQNNVSL